VIIIMRPRSIISLACAYVSRMIEFSGWVALTYGFVQATHPMHNGFPVVVHGYNSFVIRAVISTVVVFQH